METKLELPRLFKSDPDYKEKRKEYDRIYRQLRKDDPAFRAERSRWQKQYRSRPEIAARYREYRREYYKRPEVVAKMTLQRAERKRLIAEDALIDVEIDDCPPFSRCGSCGKLANKTCSRKNCGFKPR